mgnify:CR=1 FL=1
MFITREYDYALRILRTLSQGGQKTVKQVCEAEHIPQPYAYKILKKLEDASMVKAFRGAYGGYLLVAKPEQLTLYDIYTAVEGEMYINECMKEGYACPNNRKGARCSIHKELCSLQKHLIEGLQQRTMTDMLE